MPAQTDEEAAIVAVVGRPPVLGVGQDLAEVVLEGSPVEGAERLGVVEVLAEGVEVGVVLAEDVQAEGAGPPVGVLRTTASDVGVANRALAFSSHGAVCECGWYAIDTSDSPPQMLPGKREALHMGGDGRERNWEGGEWERGDGADKYVAARTRLFTGPSKRQMQIELGGTKVAPALSTRIGNYSTEVPPACCSSNASPALRFTSSLCASSESQSVASSPKKEVPRAHLRGRASAAFEL